MSKNYLFRVSQACEYLSVSRSFLYRLIADGYLDRGRRLKDSSYVVWTKDELDQFIHEHLKREASNHE